MSTYYKILPEDLICLGFQYHEGLNIDTNTINKEECSYGLHFSDTKHILHFCGYGSMIAEVEIPEDAIVYHFIDKSKADKLILKNIRPLWSVETMEALMQEDVEFKFCRNYMILRLACAHGYFDIVKYLVEHGSNIHVEDDATLIEASLHGHLEIVEYLVEQGADMHACDDYAIEFAGTPEIEEYLKSLL